MRIVFYFEFLIEFSWRLDLLFISVLFQSEKDTEDQCVLEILRYFGGFDEEKHIDILNLQRKRFFKYLAIPGWNRYFKVTKTYQNSTQYFFEIMQNRKIYISAAFYRQFCLYITCKVCHDTQYILKLDISAIHLYKSTDYKSTTQICYLIW